MEQTEKQLRKTISDSWNNSRAYLAAVGISGLVVAEVSNRIADVVDESRTNEKRWAISESIQKVIHPLAEAMDGCNALTLDTHTDAARAAAELRTLYRAAADLGIRLYESRVASRVA